MTEVKRYHVTDTGLAEGTQLGRITVVLAADFDAAQSELTALKAELASEEQDHAELRDVVAALREENERLKGESFEGLYNEAIGERDALREELAEYQKILASCKNNYVTKLAYNAVQSSLTAAEQRNATLVALLTEHQWEWEPYDSYTHRDGGYYCVECQEPKASGHEAGCKLAAALKPTESGASE